MDSRKLEHFLAAVRHANLTEAAAQCQISQPALSKSIGALERSIGVRLLERGRFGVRPTAQGEALLVIAQNVEGELRAARNLVESFKPSARQQVTIGCGPSEATRLLPMAIAALHETHPSLRVTVLYGLNEALVPMVKDGQVELALSSIPHTARDPDLAYDTLHTDSAAVIARHDHPLAAKRTVRPADLLDYGWVLARRRELERRALDELFLNAGLRPVEAMLETTSATLMKTMVLQTDWLTFLPREMVHWEELAGQLVALRVSGGSWTRNVGVTRRRRAATTPGGTALIDQLRACARVLFD